MSKRRFFVYLLILFGIFLPLASLPLSSQYDARDSFKWNIVRAVLTGEFILREGVIEVVPDRDTSLYREFEDYISEHQTTKPLSGEQMAERFYNDRYKGQMPQMEFRLKLDKKKVIIHKKRIAIPYMYVFVSGLLIIVTGAGILIFSKMRANKNRVP